jgi:hypothetical protein
VVTKHAKLYHIGFFVPKSEDLFWLNSRNVSVPEMTISGEDHCEVQSLCCIDAELIFE